MPGSNAIGSIAEVLFFACAAVILYVYVGYPLLLAVVAQVRRTSRRQPTDDYVPFLSILIAAYNEEKNIARKIEQTLSLDYPADRIEVIVLSDGSTDRTDAIVQSFADTRVRLLRLEPRRGKTHAQNQGVKQCRGDILVFSDATTVYHPLALRYLACNYQDLNVGAVSGRYQYFDPQGSSPTGLGSTTFWTYENVIKTLQSRIKTITGCCGCIYSVRRSAYTDLPRDIISDLVQPLWVIQKGYRVVFEDRALAYEETTESAAEEFAMRVRVVSRGIRGVLSVADLLKPWKFAWVSFQLVSHKILRWLIPFFLIVLFGSNVALVGRQGCRLLLVLQAVFYTCALVSTCVPLHRRWKPLSVPLYFCTLNAAALFSLIEVFRGRQYVVWQTIRRDNR